MTERIRRAKRSPRKLRAKLRARRPDLITPLRPLSCVVLESQKKKWLLRTDPRPRACQRSPYGRRAEDARAAAGALAEMHPVVSVSEQLGHPPISPYCYVLLRMKIDEKNLFRPTHIFIFFLSISVFGTGRILL